MLLRIAAVTQLALLSVLLLRHSHLSASYRQAALLFVGIACYLLAPLVLFQWQAGLLIYPILLLAIIVPVLFWYFACAVFSDDNAPQHWVHVLALITALFGVLAFCTGTPIVQECHISDSLWPDRFAQVLKLAWVIAAFVLIVKGWQDDLVESRRRFRRGIVFLGAAYIAVILVFELIIEGPVGAELELLNVTVLFVAITLLTLHLLTVDDTNVFVRMAAIPERQSQEVRSALANQVTALMEQERAYAGDGLTIHSLAQMLRTQPHRLRPVINGELGHRNFNSFVNLYRVQEVANKLQQPQLRDTPLLTLALDAGFRSLAPFNRSFKAQFGVTPSEYRENLPSSN
jgi:AraC-like DNA-binding protein